jgi:hypothetical protein
VVTFTEVERSFRVVLYGAYDAFGLIGSECNGIAILDEDHREVLTDEIAIEATGYFGPSESQVRVFETITGLKWAEFKEMVNTSRRRRFQQGDWEREVLQ